jgi:hypothetical protein
LLGLLKEFRSSGVAGVQEAGIDNHAEGIFRSVESLFLAICGLLHPELPTSLAYRAAMLQKHKLRRASLNS